MHHEALKQLGFSDKEIVVYLTLLELGPSLASTLARRANINRTTVYDLISGLESRDLVKRVSQGNNTFFFVDDVRTLLFNEQNRLRLAQELLPQLEGLQVSGQRMDVQYYRGLEGYRNVYEEILTAGIDELMGWMNLLEFYKGIDTQREIDWTKERIEQGIYVRLLLQKNDVSVNFRKDDPKSNRETRLVPDDFHFRTSCFIYDGFIVLFEADQNGKQFSAIKIRSAELYGMQKQIFEMNWQLAKDTFE